MSNYETLRELILALQRTEGLAPANVLSLPPEVGSVLRKIVRQSTVTPAQLGELLELTSAQADDLIALLVSKGYLAAQTGPDGVVYRVILARTRHRNVPDFFS